MHIEGHTIEILSLDRARCTDPGSEGTPLCLFSFRPQPDKCLDTWVLMLTPEQCLRIADTLYGFLNAPESWLYVPPEQQRELRETWYANL
jgi:hypothetical protein